MEARGVHTEVIAVGAEAVLYKELWHGYVTIRKVRIRKRYRIGELDKHLRRTRTVTEARALVKARVLGVAVPTLLEVDPQRYMLRMEYIEGIRLKELVSSLLKEGREGDVREYFVQLGEMVGKLHKGGIAHGDLTTSNVIVDRNGRLVLIDFGLAMFTHELEHRGVDVHLMLRAIESTHYEIVKEAFNAFMQGYASIVGEDEARNVLKKVHEIRLRGRYVERKLKGVSTVW